MPAQHRKVKTPAKPIGILVTCPGCGRKARAPKLGGPVRCSECGKEFKAGDFGTARRTFVFGLLGLIVITVAAYFGIVRGRRLDAEDKAKDAEEERRRKATEQGR
jgi:hypothetical protein